MDDDEPSSIMAIMDDPNTKGRPTLTDPWYKQFITRFDEKHEVNEDQRTPPPWYDQSNLEHAYPAWFEAPAMEPPDDPILS